MWGHWSFSDVFNNDIQEQVTVNVQNVNSGATMVRSFMGFGWDANFNQINIDSLRNWDMKRNFG